jgi:tRNA (cmo5U34)-methyltransferase
MNEFDIKAAAWDQNQMHWDRSETIARQIIKLIPLKKEMTALEYGAGTGITSFLLKDYLKEITLMDNSAEMIKVMDGKIETAKVNNLKTLNFDLEHNDFTIKKFDLIFTQMVLHHVSDIEAIIDRFGKLLNKGGHLAIADLYPEDGSFHGEGFNGHRGFDPDILANIISRYNFQNISYSTCFTIKKKITEYETKEFDLFLLIATRF